MDKALKQVDAVEVGNAFENWIEENYPSMTTEERASYGRMLTDFVEKKQAN